jgi:cell division protein FtsW
MRLRRILAFVDPWAHYDGAGFQVIQSLTALGNGGAMGHGLGGSLQKLYFLPEPGSDFILSIVGEELGLVGTLGVIALFTLFVVEGMRISGRARDAFGSLLAFGITCTIGLQAAINIAVVTASVPTKGIALPFISAGGSSLLFSMAGVGILLNIARQAEVGARENARRPTVAGELVS